MQSGVVASSLAVPHESTGPSFSLSLYIRWIPPEHASHWCSFPFHSDHTRYNTGAPISCHSLLHGEGLNMRRRNHLRRLERKYYQADAAVHWSINIRDRRRGWLNDVFFCRFRELLTHSLFRYGLACPMFCLMPDHLHMVWMGLCQGSDQLNAMKHFRVRCNDSLQEIGYELRDQAYDHVLKDQERGDAEFRNACEYIARNPERAGLVAVDEFAAYPYTGCLVPGYPELRPFDSDYWDRLDRTVSFLRRDGFMRT